MELRQIVDEAHSLASSMEENDVAQALRNAECIASVAEASERYAIAECARELVSALRLGNGLAGTGWWPSLKRLADALGEEILVRNGRAGQMSLDAVQVARHVNLRAILRDLRAEGISDIQDQARALHVESRFLDDMLAGGAIPDAVAREVERVTQKAEGWFDHRGPLSVDARGP
jgi:hypothetical protein